MKWFMDLKISVKILSGFALVSLIAGIIGWIGISDIRQISRISQGMYEENTRPLCEELGDASDTFMRQRAAIRDVLLETEATGRQEYVDLIREQDKGLDELLATYENSIRDTGIRQDYDLVLERLAVYREMQDQVVALAVQGQGAEALSYYRGAGNQITLDLEEAFNALYMDNVVLVGDKAAQNNETAAAATQAMVFFILGGILLAMFCGLMISRMISRPVQKLMQAADRLALGDVEASVQVESADEIGSLMKSFSLLVENIRSQAYALDKISAGNLGEEIAVRSGKDILGLSMQKMATVLNSLIGETKLLSQEAMQGNLAARGNADAFHGSYREIVAGINGTLDALVDPLRMAANYVHRISQGDIPEKISAAYHGDFNQIKDNLNTCIDAVHALVRDAALLADAAMEGRFDTRADVGSHQGSFAAIVAGMNDTIENVASDLESVPHPMMFMNKEMEIQFINQAGASLLGKSKEELRRKKCADVWGTSACRTAACPCAQAMDQDAVIQCENQTSINGNQLEIACAAAPLKNRRGEIIGAMEFVTDQTEIKKAVRVAEKIAAFQQLEAEKLTKELGEMAKGDLVLDCNIADADEDTREVRHTFVKIWDAVQLSCDGIREMAADTEMLVQAAVAGRLDTRADAAKHGGEFRQIIEGVNATLDAVIGPLNVAAEYVDRISKGDIPPRITQEYRGDFNEIKNNLNSCIDAVNALVGDADMLAAASQEGRLDTRAEASRHKGDFRKIIDGVNRTLDAVIGPLNVAADYVDRISKGDIPPKITDVYYGDFNAVKDNLNTCIDRLNGLVVDVAQLVRVAGDYLFIEQDGDISKIIDADKYAGGYRSILDAVFATLNLMYEWIYWYEQALDAVPFAIYCTDKNMRINFLNKAMEDLLGQKRSQATYKQCDIWKSPICNTELCGVTCLKNDRRQTFFAQHDKNYLVDVAYVYNKAGEQNGQLELIRDVTASTRVEQFQSSEVQRLAENLQRLAAGDINFDLAVAAGDEYTAYVRENFLHINNNLAKAKDAVNQLVSDAAMLTQAAVAGDLDSRADASHHQGDFQKIVQGVNDTLDAISRPVNEAFTVLKGMAAGDLQMKMVGEYQGDHAEIKHVLNGTQDALNGYVQEISRVLTEMADSNLDLEIVADYKGDFAQIKTALNLIIANFNQILADFNSTADQVATGSRQVSDGSQALSRGATEQASAIQQLTASINEIAVQTRQNAVSANEANGLAATAQQNAVQGNGQMQEMLKAMEEINLSSANISKIIKVIDEIAFQTNILALNAAVEAARAGQHGKGFAVVAEEVRNLAARSAGAAKETTGLIEGSLDKVSIGTRIARETAGALDRIVSDVARAADLVGSIATASNDQATGIAQVNQGVEQVAQVVQTNSATAEESAAASEELSSQAELLKEMIDGFRLKGIMQGQGRQRGCYPPKLMEPVSSSRQQSNPRIAYRELEFGKY